MCVYKWCTDIREGPNQQSLSLDSIILRVQWVWIEGFNLSPFLVIYFKGERAFLLPRWEYRAAGICISLAAVDFTCKYGLNSGSSSAQRDLQCDRAPQHSTAGLQRHSEPRQLQPEVRQDQESSPQHFHTKAWAWNLMANPSKFLQHRPAEHPCSTSLWCQCPQQQGEIRIWPPVAFWKCTVLSTALWVIKTGFSIGGTRFRVSVVISYKSLGCWWSPAPRAYTEGGGGSRGGQRWAGQAVVRGPSTQLMLIFRWLLTEYLINLPKTNLPTGYSWKFQLLTFPFPRDCCSKWIPKVFIESSPVWVPLFLNLSLAECNFD